jgi:hypothetical protein
MALNGEEIDEDKVKEIVQKERFDRNQRAMDEHLESLIDSSGRDQWREHRDRAESLQEKINEAIEKAKLYSGVPEIDAIRRILESK